jgi:hypothetical protein
VDGRKDTKARWNIAVLILLTGKMWLPISLPGSVKLVKVLPISKHGPLYTVGLKSVLVVAISVFVDLIRKTHIHDGMVTFCLGPIYTYL